MPDSAAESQKHHLSKIRPHRLAVQGMIILLAIVFGNLSNRRA
jgi:hypothetical protein